MIVSEQELRHQLGIERVELGANPIEPDNAPQHAKEYSHYYKKCPFEYVDIYRVLSLFEVNDPCLQHAIKKLLVAGGRGSKDTRKDVSEAIVTLNRWMEMRNEEVG